MDPRIAESIRERSRRPVRSKRYNRLEIFKMPNVLHKKAPLKFYVCFYNKLTSLKLLIIKVVHVHLRTYIALQTNAFNYFYESHKHI